jgi:glutathione S-transferase
MPPQVPFPTPCLTPFPSLAQVPFLEDPNAGVCLFESKAIIEYLEKTYAGAAPAQV